VTFSCRLRAPAKLNLYLHVLGLRSDGFHVMESGVTFLELCDVLTFREADKGRDSLALSGPFASGAGGEEGNTVLKSLRLLRAACASDGVPALPFLDVALEKNVPCGAGLGGGSSDAAAALRHFFPLLGLAGGRKRLREIAAEIGADTPLCLFPERDVLMGGCGERLAFLDGAWLPGSYAFVLVYPDVHAASAEVFAYSRRSCAWPVLSDRAVVRRWKAAKKRAARRRLQALKEGRNDLEKSATAVRPEITDMLSLLNALPGCVFARMTGSGSACFAVCASLALARRAAEIAREACPSAFVTATKRFRPCLFPQKALISGPRPFIN
jgi:4-diphosphocytidyl-2-C-methyl-D-erythritol kinase